MNRRQQQLIDQLTPKQLVFNVYVTQALFLLISSLAIFLLESTPLLYTVNLFSVQDWAALRLGLYIGLGIVALDFFLMKVTPREWYDDGGLNVKLFQDRPLIGILLIALTVSVAEELLFRGVIQEQLGYWVASLSFALMHIRYLTKPVLLLSVLLISFLLGWVYEETGQLLTTIVAHFTVDVLLACFIRYGKLR
ncbi:membrane protein [Pontibacillus halophilus JSM 076056 = DSM 19796]|uniref:Membrane protein n=1 Tax=Pontibacillus halophilus JSM 076056 = DSM 19796 TaxID=1385510 RepID=A0A0A5GLT0_9BACI|nr:CPBP family intramembrane glutamic endopeptidase [Pontibacillus halophilus]KGX92193.1 membrane protein [Pontibacillus halophilus JSM 076056 = DSM 19796]